MDIWNKKDQNFTHSNLYYLTFLQMLYMTLSICSRSFPSKGHKLTSVWKSNPLFFSRFIYTFFPPFSPWLERLAEGKWIIISRWLVIKMHSQNLWLRILKGKSNGNPLPEKVGEFTLYNLPCHLVWCHWHNSSLSVPVASHFLSVNHSCSLDKL